MAYVGGKEKGECLGKGLRYFYQYPLLRISAAGKQIINGYKRIK